MDLFIGIQKFQIHYSNIYEYIAPNYVNDMGRHNHGMGWHGMADNFWLTHNKNNFETYAIWFSSTVI